MKISISFLVSFILTSCTFRSCIYDKTSEIKESIAKFEDRQIPESKIQLEHNDGYYTAFREDVKDAYYLVYSLNKDTSFDICKVYTNRHWDKVDSINQIIVEANRQLILVNLKASIIYDYSDSIKVVLLNGKDLSINSVSTLKNLQEMKNVTDLVQPVP